ncbi:hypothetical protein PV726_32205 [Streptomyces europaeiscabiei]|uniref:hypothetical protein n=1 Tax=Streptomyces europaeiscabiei TaxID=146819 RepID=UPI0029B98253|nr:hypothetical protein [Streptomyces europaeiscabiei]MDX3694920.1 hypothetical protein [Streptomyces europaeiscabiei]
MNENEEQEQRPGESVPLERVDRSLRKGGVTKSVLSLEPFGRQLTGRAARRAQQRAAKKK